MRAAKKRISESLTDTDVELIFLPGIIAGHRGCDIHPDRSDPGIVAQADPGPRMPVAVSGKAALLGDEPGIVKADQPDILAHRRAHLGRDRGKALPAGEF